MKRFQLPFSGKAKPSYRIKALLLIGIALSSIAMTVKVAQIVQQDGPGLTQQTWPKGTFLSYIDRGGRLVTYHRGYVYMHALDVTTVWDISNPASPVKVDEVPVGDNGHRWWKFNGDLFWREYTVPEAVESGYKFLDLSNMMDRKPWTDDSVPFPIEDTGSRSFQQLETFPITIDGNNVNDMRTGETVAVHDFSTAPNSELKVKIGNLLLFFGNGAAAYDIGDPKNIKFLDAITGDFNQYTTTVHVWRHYLIFMTGDDNNEGGNNLVAIDFSDPSDLKYAFGTKLVDSPGRYMFFQDEYGFTGRQGHGVKLNLETLEVEHRFTSPGHPLSFSDFQWIPMGNIVVASGAETGSGKTFFYTHQDELDTKAPTVAYHNPVANATAQPLSTSIGFVINETLDDITISDKTVQVRPVDGEPIEGDIVSTSYDVFNFTPKEPLEANKTYEVTLIADGIKDVAGNGIEEFTYYFSTGSGLSTDNNNDPVVSKIDKSSQGPAPIRGNVTFTAKATDPDGDDLEYRWDFGENQAKTAWSSSNRITQIFTKKGIYQVLVQVRDGKGGVVSYVDNIVVANAFNGKAPIHSGQMALSKDGKELWSVNPDNNSVSVINTTTLKKVKEIPVGADPTGIATDALGQRWVVCRDVSKIIVFDALGKRIKTISLQRGSEPYAIVFNPDGDKGYVSLFGARSIIEVLPDSRKTGRRLSLGLTPRALSVTGDGERLLVTRFVSPDSGGKVWSVALNTFKLQKTINLAVDKTTPDSGSNGRGLPNYLAGIAMSPNSKEAWVVAKKDNIFRGLQRDGNPLTFETTVRSTLSKINLTTQKEVLNARMDIDDHAQPSSVTLSPRGTHLFMTMQGNNRLIVLDPSNGREITRVDVGLAPQSVLIDPSSQKVYVKNFMDRSVSIFDASDMLLQGKRTLKALGTVSTVETEKLGEAILKGKQIFYNAADTRMAQDGYMTCATCHIDGGEDGRTWDFSDRGEGMRNTISLKGRKGTGHGRVHWSANFDEIQDFEHDIRNGFGGKGFLSDAVFNGGTTGEPLGESKAGLSEDLDNLAAYVSSLTNVGPSPFRAKTGRLTADGLAGRKIFKELKCDACHSGTSFTDSEDQLLHDVGTMNTLSGERLGKTLLGLDAPTLRGLWNSGPYLHDGSAKSLKTIFTDHNNNGAHGNTKNLSPKELQQLVSYLKQIDRSEGAAGKGIGLELSSVSEGEDFQQEAPIPLAIRTDINGIDKVTYYANGKVIAESDTAPFSSDWTPVKWTDYTLQVKVSYNGGKTSTLSDVKEINYKRGFSALMVVGSLPLQNGDEVVLRHLEKSGFDVETVDDDDVDQGMARSKDIVFVSSSTIPSKFGEDLTHMPVPVMTWNPFSYSHFRFTDTGFNTDFGYTENPEDGLTLSVPGHPISAGKSGKIKIYDIVQKIPFGTPTADYIDVLATSDGVPVIFGMNTGGDFFRQKRKVAFPLRGDFVHLFTDEGWELFDAAIDWVIYGGDENTGLQPLPDVQISSPKDGASVGKDFSLTFFTDNWDIAPGGLQVQYDIDGQGNRSVFTNAPIDIRDLSPGLHTITVKLAQADYQTTGVQHTIQINVTNGALTSVAPSEKDIARENESEALLSPLAILYPNPSRHDFTLSAQEAASIHDVKIYDQQGKLVYTIGKNSLKAGTPLVFGENFRLGTYLVIITTDLGLQKMKILKH